MPRPNRLYTIDGKYYYLKDGKKVFVKVPSGVSQKQVSKINIKNIIKLAETKRVVRKKKRRNLSYQKKIAPSMEKSEVSGLPIYFYKPKREISTIDEIVNNSTDTSIDKLGKILLKGIKATPGSTKLPAEPTIVSPTTPAMRTPTTNNALPIGLEMTTGKRNAEQSQEAYDRAMAERRRIQKEDADFREAQRQSLIQQTRERVGKAKPKKASLNPNVAGLATTITGEKMETGITPGKDTTRKAYVEGASISTGKYERAVELARTRPGFIERASQAAKNLFSPGNIRPAPETKSNEMEPRRLTYEEMKEKYPSENNNKGPSAGYGSDGLYDDEMEIIAKKRLKDYIPVIAKDETNELMKYIKKGDKQFSFVINTDNSDQPGRHWRCVYINNMDDYPSIEYFDPLTEGKPEQSLIDICRKIAIKMNPNKLFKYKQNQIRRQSKLTSNCGYHCIHFLEGRYQGIPFSEITGYDKFVEDMKKENGDLDGSGTGEKEIKPFMKAYDSYI